MKEIKNQYLIVLINELGAEVRSVINSTTGHSYLHDGNPNIWSGVSPILFPAIGRSYNDKFKYKDNIYSISKHGFARNSIFNVVNHTDDMVKFSLDTKSYSNYPFNMELLVTYKLVNKSLVTQYKVTNKANSPAIFALGAHPAFTCPFSKDLKLEEYYLEFEHDEILTKYLVTVDGYLKNETYSLNCKQIMLTPNTFDNDALVFSGFKSNYIDLMEKNSKRKIRVSISGFSHLGIWAKPGRSNFVCIEPWCGRADNEGYANDLEFKDSIVKLSGHGIWEKEYTIFFNY